MAGSILKLPSGFDEDKIYSLKGKTLNEMMAALQADRVVPGNGQTESQTAKGRVINGAGVGVAGGVAGGCPLGMFTASATEGDVTLAPGFLSFLGGGSIWLTGDVTVPADDSYLLLKINFTANIESHAEEEFGVTDYFDLSGTINSWSFVVLTTIPANATFSASSTPAVDTGDYYVPLGKWEAGEFYQAGCGSINLGFCPTGLSHMRTG